MGNVWPTAVITAVWHVDRAAWPCSKQSSPSSCPHLDHLQHSAACAGAQVVHHATQLGRLQLPHGCDVPLSQVHDMDVVPHWGTIAGVVVLAEHAELGPLLQGYLLNVGQ